MKSRRRYLTFSLRTLFVLLTALAVWLGIVVNRAREQREAAKAIKALGGKVYYNWEITAGDRPQVHTHSKPPGVLWLRKLVGDEFFQNVEIVTFTWYSTPPSEAEILKAIIHLQRLQELKFVILPDKGISSEMQHEVQEALPHCEVCKAEQI